MPRCVGSLCGMYSGHRIGKVAARLFELLAVGAFIVKSRSPYRAIVPIKGSFALPFGVDIEETAVSDRAEQPSLRTFWFFTCRAEHDSRLRFDTSFKTMLCVKAREDIQTPIIRLKTLMDSLHLGTVHPAGLITSTNPEAEKTSAATLGSLSLERTQELRRPRRSRAIPEG